MKNKTFKCPYLTAEDKEFLEYEQKIYEQNFKMLLGFHKKHEKLLKCTDDEAIELKMTHAKFYWMLDNIDLFK